MMEKINFNGDWMFWSEENPQVKIPVHLPHDAMQWEERVPGLKNGPLVAEYPGGDYWYEKHFHGDGEMRGKTLMLEFGGVFMKSTVYLNGQNVGGHVYGYSNFFVDLTDYIRIGEENVLQVFVHNSQVPNSRWYSGSGIYRPVFLRIGAKEHVVPDGVKIDTLSLNPAVLSIHAETTREDGTDVVAKILWQGREVASGTGETCTVAVEDARLWSEDEPNLYEYEVCLVKNGLVIDRQREHFGIRLLRWNGDQGLLVNGKSVKLRGICMHHDNGVIGAVESKKAVRRKVKRLKEGGINAIRGSHNPASRELLEACDELGMYYVEEFFDGWFTSGTYGYVLYIEEEWDKDMELSVRKCYNHPSVIMYSIGNEVPETASEKGLSIAGKMVGRLRALDVSRPVTMGVNLTMNVMFGKGMKLGNGESDEVGKDDVVDPKSEDHDNKMDGSVLFNMLIGIAAAEPFIKACAKPKRSDPVTRGIFDVLDVAGYNYGDVSYAKHHEWHPERVMVGTETKSIGMKKRMQTILDMPSVIGDFLWTGWDYLGECGLGVIDYGKRESMFGKPYPCITAGCGLYDITGLRQTLAYDVAMAWKRYDKPYIAVSPLQHAGQKMYKSMYRTTDGIDSWTFPGYEGTKTTVRVASVGEKAELFVSGTSCGTKKLHDLAAEFKVPYEPGELVAVSFDKNGNRLNRAVLATAKGDMGICLAIDEERLQADGEDLLFVDITLADSDGVYYPVEKKLHVSVEGAAGFFAAGSANPRTTEKYTKPEVTTYYGRALAVIRSGTKAGKIKVSVSGEGPETVSVELESVPAD